MNIEPVIYVMAACLTNWDGTGGEGRVRSEELEAGGGGGGEKSRRGWSLNILCSCVGS